MKIFGTVKLTYMHAYSIYTPGPENVSLLAKVANELSLNARMHFRRIWDLIWHAPQKTVEG